MQILFGARKKRLPKDRILMFEIKPVSLHVVLFYIFRPRIPIHRFNNELVKRSTFCIRLERSQGLKFFPKKITISLLISPLILNLFVCRVHATTFSVDGFVCGKTGLLCRPDIIVPVLLHSTDSAVYTPDTSGLVTHTFYCWFTFTLPIEITVQYLTLWCSLGPGSLWPKMGLC